MTHPKGKVGRGQPQSQRKCELPGGRSPEGRDPGSQLEGTEPANRCKPSEELKVGSPVDALVCEALTVHTVTRPVVTGPAMTGPALPESVSGILKPP